MLHFTDYLSSSVAKGNNVSCEIVGFEDHELSMRVIILCNDLWASRNYITDFELHNMSNEEFVSTAIGFENKDITVWNVISHLDTCDLEILATKWLADDNKDWDHLEALLCNNDTFDRATNALLDLEYNKSISTMLDWTKAEDEEGFSFFISDSDWHSKCGKYSIHKNTDGYVVDPDGINWKVDTLDNARWFAEALDRDWTARNTVDKKAHNGYINERRVGAGKSTNWYMVVGEWYESELITKRHGNVTVFAYDIEGDNVGGQITKFDVYSYDEYIEKINDVNTMVIEW